MSGHQKQEKAQQLNGKMGKIHGTYKETHMGSLKHVKSSNSGIAQEAIIKGTEITICYQTDKIHKMDQA